MADVRKRQNLVAFIRPENSLPARWGIYSIADAQWLAGAFASESAATAAAKSIEAEGSILELVGKQVALWVQ